MADAEAAETETTASCDSCDGPSSTPSIGVGVLAVPWLVELTVEVAVTVLTAWAFAWADDDDDDDNDEDEDEKRIEEGLEAVVTGMTGVSVVLMIRWVRGVIAPVIGGPLGVASPDGVSGVIWASLALALGVVKPVSGRAGVAKPLFSRLLSRLSDELLRVCIIIKQKAYNIYNIYIYIYLYNTESTSSKIIEIQT